LEGVHHPADHHVKSDEQYQFYDFASAKPAFHAAEDVVGRSCFPYDGVRKRDQVAFGVFEDELGVRVLAF
ncbi:MAG TPA: hypothetical protein VIM40_11050, partial [Arthrobacter sp.]